MRPDIGGARWVVEAFNELATTRAYTFGGAAPIPVTAIWQWQDRNLAPAWFVEAIMALDNHWLEKANRSG